MEEKVKAFPGAFMAHKYGDKEPSAVFEGGMDLRDYFAAAALTGMLADSRRTANLASADRPDKELAVLNAQWAYQLADAMLKERDK